jgi:hypothetical protein
MENLNVNQEMNFEEMADVVGGCSHWVHVDHFMDIASAYAGAGDYDTAHMYLRLARLELNMC